MSESIYLVTISTMLLFALRWIDRPNRWDFAVLGLLIAIAALIRSDAVGFVVLLGIPTLVFSASRWKERPVFGMALLAGLVLLMAPASSQRLGDGSANPVYHGGDTLSGSYCPATFSQRVPTMAGAHRIASWVTPPYPQERATAESHETLDRLALTDALGSAGTTYAKEHLTDCGDLCWPEKVESGTYMRQVLSWSSMSQKTEMAHMDPNKWAKSDWVLLPFALVGAFRIANAPSGDSSSWLFRF